MTLIESPSSIGSASIGSASIGSASIDVEEIGTAPIPIMRPVLGDAEVSAVTEVLRSGWVAQGPRVAAFESAFAASVRAAEGVAVSSCTTGLHLALVLAGVGPGDEVVVPSLSFIATTNAVVYTGATPVFADVDLATGNVTAASIGEVITDRTRAVVVVDQAGVPADIEPIRRLCRSLDLAVVEDAACAIGSTHEGAPVGAGGTAVFSFHPRKILTTGEGGMITLDDPDHARRARRLREHGMSQSAADRHGSGGLAFEEYGETGFNYRMTDLQAAIGLVQLTRLGEIVSRRRELARAYQARLATVPGLTCVDDPAWGTTNYQSFWIRLDSGFGVARNDVMAALARVGIASRRGIMATHLEPAGERFVRGRLPVTERITSTTLILPLFHEMTYDDVDRVCAAIRDCRP